MITREMCSEDATQNRSLVDESRIWFSELFDHLSHCGAFFGTVSTRFCTCCHLLVVRKLFACGGTIITALGAAFTCVSTEIALAGTK